MAETLSIEQPKPIAKNIFFEGRGQFAREMLDDAPPKKGTTFVDEFGAQSPIEPSKVGELNSVYWRSKQPLLHFILLICAFGLFAVLLNSMQKYTDISWDIFTGSFGTVFSFIKGVFGFK